MGVIFKGNVEEGVSRLSLQGRRQKPFFPVGFPPGRMGPGAAPGGQELVIQPPAAIWELGRALPSHAGEAEPHPAGITGVPVVELAQLPARASPDGPAGSRFWLPLTLKHP